MFFWANAYFYKSYPFIIHIPLILVIRYVCHKNIYISTIAVLSAYLMCTPRKWFGTVAAYIFKDIPMISDIVTIIITIPLLFIVIKYISPYIIRLENESKTIIFIFFFLPLTYYISEYAFTVYTDLLYRGEAIVIEFMDSFIVILLLFIIYRYTYYFEQGKMQLKERILSCLLLLHRQKKRFHSCMNIKDRLPYIVMILGII